MVLLIFLFSVLIVIFYCIKRTPCLGIAMSAGASELLGFTLLILVIKNMAFSFLFTFLVCEGGMV